MPRRLSSGNALLADDSEDDEDVPKPKTTKPKKNKRLSGGAALLAADSDDDDDDEAPKPTKTARRRSGVASRRSFGKAALARGAGPVVDMSADEVAAMCVRGADPQTSRGDAAAATWIFRGDVTATRRGYPRRRVAATPRPRRGHSVAAAATRTFRGDESRRRRACDVDIPWRRIAAAATRTFRGGDAAAAT